MRQLTRQRWRPGCVAVLLPPYTLSVAVVLCDLVIWRSGVRSATRRASRAPLKWSVGVDEKAGAVVSQDQLGHAGDLQVSLPRHQQVSRVRRTVPGLAKTQLWPLVARRISIFQHMPQIAVICNHDRAGLTFHIPQQPFILRGRRAIALSGTRAWSC